MFWLGCNTQSTNLVRDFHSVRYPVCRTTENRSWSVLSQWYSCLTLNSERLVGFCRDSYCAYSDTEIRVKIKAQNAMEYWYWFNYLFVGFYQLVSVHIIMFMLSPCVFSPLNFDYNWYNTLFYKIHQGIEITHTCVPSIRLLRQVHGSSNRCTFALANGLAGRFIYR